jgi:hypothetical protein
MKRYFFKKSMALFVAITSVVLFSFLALHVLQTKNIIKHNQGVYELQNQAMLHLHFFTQLIQQTQLSECLSTLNFEDEYFTIKAQLTYIYKNSTCIKQSAKVDLYVSYKNQTHFPINLHHRFMKEF